MADTKWSQFPSQTPVNADEVVGLHSGGNARFSIANIVAAVRNGLANIFVPLTRTINGKGLSTDITLDASDVGAVATSAVGAANGVASLDNTGKVPSAQLPSIPSDASDIDYDNTQSGLTADNVQDALDELAQGGGGGPSPYTSNPAMDGTASPGSSNDYTRGDHVHPTDTSRQSTITASGILKGDGQGGISAAVAGTDYQAPLTAGTDYATPAQLADKANPGQIGYPESGATASRNYSAGEYICWNGLTYTADTNIALGTTLSASGGNKNLTECVGGGFNASIVPVDDSASITYDSTYIDALQASALRVGKLCVVQLSIKFKSIRVPGHTALINNLQPAKVDLLPRFFGNDGSYIKLYIAAGETSIKKDEGQNTGGTWYIGTIVYFRT